MFGALAFVILIGGIITAAIIFSIKTAEETKRKWENAARQLKLRFLKGSLFNPGVITGEIKDHMVKVDTFTRNSGKNSQTYTRFRIDYAKPLKLPFVMTKQGFFQNLGKVFGMQDVEIGDASFDDVVVIKSKYPSDLKKFLSPERKQVIKRLIGSFPEVTVTNSHIEVIIRGSVRNSKLIVSNINWLTKTADIIFLEGEKETSRKKQKKTTPELNKKNSNDLLAEVVSDKNAGKPEVVELMPEIIASENIKDKKHDLSEKAVPEKKKSENIENKELIEKQVKQDESESITAEFFCSQVFAPDVGTFDSSKIFEEKFKEEEISWEGNLISAQEFSFDFVFKNTTGVKAVFELMEIKSGYSTNMVKAVVHFPKDKLELLKRKLKSKMKFSGKLVSIDGLVKNIFVDDGKLA